MKKMAILLLGLTLLSACTVMKRKYMPGFYINNHIHNRARNYDQALYHVRRNNEYRPGNLAEPVSNFDNKCMVIKVAYPSKSTTVLTASINKTAIPVKTEEFMQLSIFPSDTAKATTQKAIRRTNNTPWGALVISTLLIGLIGRILSTIPATGLIVLSFLFGLSIYMAVLGIYRRINAMITHNPVFNHYKRSGRHTVIDGTKPPYYSLAKCIFGIVLRLGFLYCDFCALLLFFLPGVFMITAGFGAVLIGIGLVVGLIVALLDISSRRLNYS